MRNWASKMKSGIYIIKNITPKFNYYHGKYSFKVEELWVVREVSFVPVGHQGNNRNYIKKIIQ